MIEAVTDLKKGLINFVHYTPTEMSNGDIHLVLNEKCPINIEKLWVPSYKFDIIKSSKNICVGNIDFRVALTDKLILYGGHISYYIKPEFRGNRYSAKSIILLLPFIQEHDIDEILITCDPNNIASRKTCEIAGFKLLDILKNLEIEPNVFRDTCRYIMRL